MRYNRGVLELLLWWNGLTAAIGGIGLIGGGARPPIAWLDGTPFESYIIPGLILMLVVGGSSLLAAVMLRAQNSYARATSMAAGIIMLGWIAGEILEIRHFSWLQIIYIVTGSAVYLLALHTGTVWRTFKNIRL